MAASKVELRLAALETEVADLKLQVEAGKEVGRDWLDDVWGSFADDPLYDEIVAEGRKYRESLRPKGRRLNGKQSKIGGGD